MRKHLTLAFLLYLCVPISALAATSEIDKSKCSTYTTQENCTGLCTWNTETNTCEMATIITGCVAKFTEETCNADDNCEWVTDDSGNGTCQDKTTEDIPCRELIKDQCNTTPGCGFVSGQGCAVCPSGTYNPGGTDSEGCTGSCPTDYPETDTDTSSDFGATSIEGCFKNCYDTCKAKTVDNGKYELTPGSSEKAYYDNTCSCTLTCNNTSDLCYGYHSNIMGTACIKNKSELKETDEYKYFEITASATSKPEQYITECKKDDQHFEDSGTKCSTSYGDCIDNTHSCESDTTIGDAGNPRDIIPNTIEITGNVTWNNENKAWDYSACRLTAEFNIFDSTTYGKKTYKFQDQQWTPVPDSTQIIRCGAGYYYNQTKDSTQCSQVEAGYYSPDKDTERYACPGGATSNTGATAKTECFINKETQFCNNDGTCFNLSDFGDIEIFTIK